MTNRRKNAMKNLLLKLRSPLFLLFAALCSTLGRSYTLGEENTLVQEKKKNVLFLMADEHSGQVLGAAGNDIVQTPNLDALAKSSINFKNAYCINPVCVPARASLATGIRPSKLGVFNNAAHKQDVLRDTPSTLARMFTDAGYNTEWLGKEHWGTTNDGLGFGEENERLRRKVVNVGKAYLQYSNDMGRAPKNAEVLNETLVREVEDLIIANHAKRWLDEYDDDKPFFLGVSFYMPHFPFHAHQEYYDLYKDTIDVPRVTPEMLEDLSTANKFHRRKYDFGSLTEQQIKKARAMYFGMVSFIDEQLGRLIKVIDKKGIRNETIIVYVSDHGELAGEHGLWYKNSFYEDAVNVPMILSYPGGTQAKVLSPVYTMDIVPTLYELCNIEIPEGLDARSVMPILRGEEDGYDRHVVSENYAKGDGRMVRLRHWKYCWYEDGRNQLFDLKVDPAEEFNLYNHTEYAGLIARFNKKALEDYIPKPPFREKKTEAPNVDQETSVTWILP